MGKQQVTMTKYTVTKKFGSNTTYNKERFIYGLNLPYVAKIIKYDDENKIIVLNYECCMPLTKVPIKKREKYYEEARQLFWKFHKDTGFYLKDYHPGNIILNNTPGQREKLVLIDFEHIQETPPNYRKYPKSFLNKIGVLNDLESKPKSKLTSSKSKRKISTSSKTDAIVEESQSVDIHAPFAEESNRPRKKLKRSKTPEIVEI